MGNSKAEAGGKRWSAEADPVPARALIQTHGAFHCTVPGPDTAPENGAILLRFYLDARRGSPRWVRCFVPWLTLFSFLLSGCSVPPRAGVSRGVDGRRAERAWWVVTGDGAGAPSVVGLERRLKGGGIEQWLISTQGARRLQYAGQDVMLWGAPLAPNGDDFAEDAPLAVYAWSGGQVRLPESSPAFARETVSDDSLKADASPQGADVSPHGADASSHGADGLPQGAVSVVIDDADDLARWLHETLPGLQVDPPAGFTIAVGKEAMFDFPRGIEELLALEAAFK